MRKCLSFEYQKKIVKISENFHQDHFPRKFMNYNNSIKILKVKKYPDAASRESS